MNTVPASLRRRALLLAAFATAPLLARAADKPGRVSVEIWKDPECGCCKDWVAHLEANGFSVAVHESGNDAARQRLGVEPRYASCHTALVGGYAIEGHVPASEVHRLLRERPVAIGLAVPGMPVGAPGMDGPAYGGRRNTFDVLLLTRGAAGRIYRHYEGNKA